MPVHPRVVEATRRLLEDRRAVLASSARHVGWKVALDFPEIEAVIGPRPAVGYISTATVVEAGGAFSLAPLREPRVETELVAVLGRDVSLGASRHELLAAVEALAVGLEVVDVARPPDDLEGIIAGNVAHRAVVIGEPHAVAPDEERAARTWIDGELREEASGGADLGERLAGLAAVLEAAGERLRAGDRVLAGSLTHVEARIDQRVVAEIDGFGAVDLRLTA